MIIQSNIFGLAPDGSHNGNYKGEVYYTPDYALYFQNVKDALIGGESPAEGNYVYARKTLYSYTGSTTQNGFLKLINNKIGTDISGTISNEGSSSTTVSEIKIYGSSFYNVTSDVSIEIRKNTIVGQIYIDKVSTYFTIKSNKIYGTNWFGEYYPMITIGECKGIIGGESDEEGNDIYAQSYIESPYFKQTAIAAGKYTEIRHNTIHCNTYEGSSVNPDAQANAVYQPDDYPWIVTDVLKPGYVEGRACKKCRVDVYEDDECHACEGKVFLGSVTAGDDGKWSFTGSFTGTVVAMATDETATTSGFSAPWVITDEEKIVQPDCHISNGSIKGLKLIGADRFEWKKMTFVTGVGEVATVITNTSIDLDNLAPGTYEISPGFGSTCNGISRRYILGDDTYTVNDGNPAITQPSCGQNNGSILSLTVHNPDFSKSDGYKSLVWKETTTNAMVGNGLGIENVFPGKYRMYVTSNGGCVDSSLLYILTNQSGPSLVTTSVVISNETCGAGNGSITGISVDNSTGTPSVQWKDDKDNIAGNAFDLKNVPAGMYRLEYKDGSACGTITTNYYTIANDGAIAIDESLEQIKASSCTVADGAITGITVTGGNTYQWMSTANNTTIPSGNSPDLLNIPAGSYQLSVSNSFGCKETSLVIEVKQSHFIPPLLSSVSYLDASCDEPSGYIHPRFGQSVSDYRFEWTDSLRKIVVGNSMNAQKLPASQYYLVVTDPNQCKEKLLSQTIIQLGKPVIDNTLAIITDDVCHTSTGSITNLHVMNGGRPDYTWKWYALSGESINSTTSQVTSLPAGMYYATVADKDGCLTTSEAFAIKNNEAQLPVPLLAINDVSAGSAATIRILNANAGVYELYRNPADAAPVATSTGNTITTPAVTTDGSWYVRNKNGDCVSEFAKADINVIRKTRLAIPSAFTPNGDGVNDDWHIGWQGVMSQYKLAVYDRYGKTIFTSQDINKNWNGKLNGVSLNTGSYVYIITLKDNEGVLQHLTGMVTIVN